MASLKAGHRNAKRKQWQRWKAILLLRLDANSAKPVEAECNADLDHPCDSGPDGDPCFSCRATEAEYRREWERTGRRDYERQQTYVQDMIDAGREHLLPL